LAEVQARISEATSGAVELRLDWDAVPGDISASTGFGLMLESTDPSLTFEVTGDAAEDLGLSGTSDGEYLVGDRVLGGLDGILLSSLSGDLSALFSGSFSVTDGLGNSTTTPIVAPAEAVGSVGALMAVINQQLSNQFVSARVELNAQGNGLQLIDTSGFNSIEASGELADNLGWTAPNRNSNGVANGFNLQRAWVGAATKLSTLSQGQGIGTGTFQITDGLGGTAVVNLDGSEQTIQDLLDEINSKGLALLAQVNATGDGIELVEQLPDGTSSFRTIQVDALSGSAASDLGLVGSASEVGAALEGRWEYVIDLDPSDTLESLVEKIDASGAPVQAGLVNVGGLSPWRLSLTSDVAGAGGDLVMDLLSDGSAPQFQLDPVQRGQDAKILFGAGSLGGGFLVTSGSNTLSGVIEGVTIDLLAASDEQTTLTIERDDSSLSEGLQALVDAYNGLRDKADQYDSYDSESLQKGTLYGNANLRSFVSELTRIVTQDVDGLSGPYRSLQDLGVSIDGEGRLSFEAEVFTEALAVDREGVEALLSATLEEEPAESAGETPVVEGLGPRLDSLLEGWLSPEGRLQTIQDGITDRLKRNDDSIAALQTRIQAERERLLREFYVMEQTLARLQSQSNALAGLVVLPQGSAG
jgi:flagellar hook-associated protein 2